MNTTDHASWKAEALAWRDWAVTQEEELREKLKNIPRGERHLRFTRGVIYQIEEILGK